MSSTIFYKFLHQKNQSTIHFDGTGISVFDLKHEIIVQNQLGQGTDFNLTLYHLEQPDLEYENDQDVIPRSTFVIARRSPSVLKNGKFNNASRYVTGKPRINRKAVASTAISTNTLDNKQLDESISEEDRIKLMFENQSNAWAQTQDELSTHKVVYNKPNATANPEDLPPPGYMCYRCGGKNHWIRNCPTNSDPNFEGKKIKRTTGIPKSYLKTISKEAVEGNNESNPENKITTNENGDLVDNQGNTYMITESGEYVIAVADSKTWLNYQQKQQNAAMKAKLEYDQKILECIIKDSKSEFLDPLATQGNKVLQAPIVMTPCCQDASKLKKLKNFNYNQLTLEQQLIENDFHCPNCGAEDAFIDSLIRNKALEESLAAYVKEKEKELGIEDQAVGTKRLSEEDDSDPKKQKLALPMKPPLMVPGMPMPPMPPMPGMPMPPMPPMPGMPMFIPPTPPFMVNNNQNNSKK